MNQNNFFRNIITKIIHFFIFLKDFLLLLAILMYTINGYIMLKAYKYRLYPKNKQQVLLNKHFGCCRFIYNWALETAIKQYQKDKTQFSKYDLIKQITKKKKQTETSWLSEVNSQSLQYTIQNLDTAFVRFFKKKARFPKFKNKNQRQSFSCPQNVKIDFHNSTVRLPKIGKIKAVFSREFKGKIKTCTISRTKINQYFISMLIEDGKKNPIPTKPNKRKAVGIDLGIKDFAITSDGEKTANPRCLKKSLGRLKCLQRRASRKKKGSLNRKKANFRLAKVYNKITNQRSDFLHKLSTKLIRENQTICLEDLNISGMMKNHCLAQAISDVSWSKFVDMLKYKAEWYGKNIIQINRFSPSSKMCNYCGWIKKDLTLKDRIWKCKSCGKEVDRDINAAKNILDLGFHPKNLFHEGVENNKKKYSPMDSGVEPVELSGS